MDSSNDDPFGMFGDDDDADEVETSTTRDPSCGVLAFHVGTEQRLWNFVQMEWAKENSDSDNATSNNDSRENVQSTLPNQNRTTTKDRSEIVLKLVDQFCYERHWMMHVGPEKGPVLQDFLLDCFRCHYPSNDSNSSKKCPLVIVELGTYCGYSSILMASTLLEERTKKHPSSQDDYDFHIYSVDVDPHHQAVAKQLATLAGLESYVSFLLLTPPADDPYNAKNYPLVQLLQQGMLANSPTNNINPNSYSIDFLFLDHDKDFYLPDLQVLEQSGMIQPGTYVAADNVVFFQTPYRDHIQKLAQQGIVETRLVQGRLEYVIKEELFRLYAMGNTDDPTKDGIELTVYQKDPRSTTTIP